MIIILRAISRVAVILSAAALPVAATSQAPAQTQESAVRFLGLFASEQQPPMKASTRFDKLDPHTRLTMAVPPTTWTDVTPFDPKHPCRVDLKYSDGKLVLIDWDKSDVIFHTRANWSEAMLASDYGPLIKPVIEIRSKGTRTSYAVWPTTEEQGARLFRAMQFLASSCDPMNKTGF